jgi:ribosome-binding protein aMBF1 (putative translation factor)
MKTTKLKQKLMDKGTKHKWLAQRSGLNESILSLIINGRYNPDKRQREKISAAMEMNEKELFEQ